MAEENKMRPEEAKQLELIYAVNSVSANREQRVKFEILVWDWEQQICFGEVNQILEDINEPVRFKEIPLGGDSYCVAIHATNAKFTDAEWRDLAAAVLNDEYGYEELGIKPPTWKGAYICDGTVKEIREYISRYKAL